LLIAKVKLLGVPIIFVDPKETSKNCPSCRGVFSYIKHPGTGISEVPTVLEH